MIDGPLTPLTFTFASLPSRSSITSPEIPSTYPPLPLHDCNFTRPPQIATYRDTHVSAVYTYSCPWSGRHMHSPTLETHVSGRYQIRVVSRPPVESARNNALCG